jgi:hypothetical protein
MSIGLVFVGRASQPANRSANTKNWPFSNQPSNILGDLRVIGEHLRIVAGEKEIEGGNLRLQFIIGFHPGNHIGNEATWDFFFIISENVGAV